MFRFAGKKMPSPQENGEDRATAAVLACGGTDGVPAFVLRHWRPGGDSTEPVFIIWLLGIGRFCLTVKYGRYSLRGEDWRLDTGRASGPRRRRWSRPGSRRSRLARPCGGG